MIKNQLPKIPCHKIYIEHYADSTNEGYTIMTKEN